MLKISHQRTAGPYSGDCARERLRLDRASGDAFRGDAADHPPPGQPAVRPGIAAPRSTAASACRCRTRTSPMAAGKASTPTPNGASRTRPQTSFPTGRLADDRARHHAGICRAGAVAAPGPAHHHQQPERGGGVRAQTPMSKSPSPAARCGRSTATSSATPPRASSPGYQRRLTASSASAASTTTARCWTSMPTRCRPGRPSRRIPVTALLVADASKFGRNATVRGGHLDDCHHLFTDGAPPPAFAPIGVKYAERIHTSDASRAG